MSQEKQILLGQEELGRTLSRMAHEVVEKTTNPNELVLIGIRSRGVHLARRMARKIEAVAKTIPPVGVIDISQYRDDRAHDVSAAATIPFEVPVSVDDKTVVLVDDVIFRGRTIRAAMEAVGRLGQPKRILVAVLDRSRRPGAAHSSGYRGQECRGGEDERINVMLEESDGIDQVALVPWQTKVPSVSDQTMSRRNLISIADLSNDEIEQIFDLADAAHKLRSDKVADGRIMATLFYEPSTRTRLSFESAMQRLGGSVISCSDMRASSTAKGETVADTARVVASYADVLVVRHYWDGAVQAMAEYADVPVINAGDGAHEHPTQTLCDLYTLKKEKGELKGLTVVICGDLKNGRTIHSLVCALARFEANIVTLAANGMELPQYVLERLEREYGYSLAPVASDDLSAVVTETDALYLTPKQPHQLALFTEVDLAIQSRLSSMVSGLRYDAFYMTRKQKERMKEGTTGGSYPTIGAGFLREQRFKDTVVMHPLPRVDELSPEVDKDRRGIYFKQAAYGVPVRMALLKFLFDQARRQNTIRQKKQGPV